MDRLDWALFWLMIAGSLFMMILAIVDGLGKYAAFMGWFCAFTNTLHIMILKRRTT